MRQLTTTTALSRLQSLTDQIIENRREFSDVQIAGLVNEAHALVRVLNQEIGRRDGLPGGPR